MFENDPKKTSTKTLAYKVQFVNNQIIYQVAK